MANTLPRWMTGKVWEEPDAVKPPKAPNAWQNVMGVFGQANQQAGAQAAQSQRLNDQLALQQQQQAGAMANQATVDTGTKANLFNMLQSVYAQNQTVAPTATVAPPTTDQQQPDTGAEPTWRPEPGKVFGQFPRPNERQGMEAWWDVLRRGINELKQKYPQYAQYLSAALPELPQNWNPGTGTMAYWFAPLDLEAALESGNTNLIRDYARKLNQFYQSGFPPGGEDIQYPPGGDDTQYPPGGAAGDVTGEMPGARTSPPTVENWSETPPKDRTSREYKKWVIDRAYLQGRINERNWQSLMRRLDDGTLGMDEFLTYEQDIEPETTNDLPDPKSYTGGTGNTWADYAAFMTWANDGAMPYDFTPDMQQRFMQYMQYYYPNASIGTMMWYYQKALDNQTLGDEGDVFSSFLSQIDAAMDYAMGASDWKPPVQTGGGGDGGAAARKLEQQLQDLIQRWQNTTTSGQLRGGAAPTTWYY